MLRSSRSLPVIFPDDLTAPPDTGLSETFSPVAFRGMSNAVRVLAMDAVEQAASGHPGMPMGMADVATVLFARHLKFDSGCPDWPDRDRFVLSAGHGSMLLYALLHLTGYADFALEELKRFRQLGSRTAGHPEYGHGKGIETTTGPLGQGLANAVGMALAERMLNARFGNDLVSHRTWVIAGDGCLMEGISHEAASLAGHLRLGRLTVLLDDNGISIDGPTSLAMSDDYPARFAALGWHTQSVDGHDAAAVDKALSAVADDPRPSLICCRTTIAWGAPTKAGTADAHGAPLGADEIAGARAALDWPHAPFEIPDEIGARWHAVGARGRTERATWEARQAAGGTRAEALMSALAGELPEDLGPAVAGLVQKFSESSPSWATRKASQAVLDELAEIVPDLVGGSADLTGSNNTRASTQEAVAPGDYAGRYLYWGVRELGMAACMNGIALHGGLIPYGGTFLVFSDYARSAIRLAALMGIRVIHVATHDSIGLGEDGPTHQPVEHLASLRAIPNLLVLRPADAVETAECWQLALEHATGPSIIALTRQGVPTVRTKTSVDCTARRGGYVLRDAPDARAVLIASGSEVSVAMTASDLLAEEGIATRVVSLPSWELFEAQDEAYREQVLGSDTLRVGIEAATRFGWSRWLGPDGEFFGMTGFGASAPASDLFRHFGISAEAVVDRVRMRLGCN